MHVCDTALRPGNSIDNDYDFTLSVCVCACLHVCDTHISHDMPQENPPLGMCVGY